jgi:hypothetical protein
MAMVMLPANYTMAPACTNYFMKAARKNSELQNFFVTVLMRALQRKYHKLFYSEK